MTYKKASSSALVAVSLFLSYALLICVEPEIFLNHSVSFLSPDPAQIIYSMAFRLTADTFRHGIQLWNPYDQMPVWFMHCIAGLYTYNNLLVALAYRIFSPFFDSPGRAFHVLYSTVSFLSFNVVSTLGFFLLLRRFSDKAGALVFSMVYSSTILNQTVYNNALHGPPIFALFPLMIHLILKFFESPKLDPFLWASLTFVVAVATLPLMSFAYFYQCAHLVILPAAVWCLLKNRTKMIGGIQSLFHRPAFAKKLLKITGAVLLSGLILLPTAIMMRESMRDLDFDQSHSRLHKIFSVKYYFDQAKNVCPQDLNPMEDLLTRSVDFSRNRMLISWLFIGQTMVFLVLAGIFLNRDSRKYIFLFAAVLFWLVNAPRDKPAWFPMAAHWLNALTNPVSFMSRAFGITTAFLMPYILLPLAVMGLHSLLQKAQQEENRSFWQKTPILMVWLACAGFYFLVQTQMTTEVRRYLVGGQVLIGIVFLLLCLNPFKKRAAALSLMLGLLFLADVYAAGGPYAKAFNQYLRITPQPLYQRDSIGPVILDYQNPEIDPLRDRFSRIPMAEPELSFYYIPPPRIGTEGLFFRSTYLGKYFEPATNYTPRHISYTRLALDKALQDHLNHHSVFLHEADREINDREWRVYEYPLSKARSKALKRIPAYADPGPLPWSEIKQLDTAPPGLPVEEAKLTFYSLDLPKDFPAYLATEVLTDNSERQLKASIGDKILLPAQGYLSLPFSFDVQNVRTGELIVSLPPDFKIQNKILHLEYAKEGLVGITSWRRYEPDNLSFDYLASKNTRVVLHYPFDPKWKLWVDGKPETISRAENCFIGFPLEKGKHEIILRYWPGTPLRALILVSVILYCACLTAIFIKSFREPQPPVTS